MDYTYIHPNYYACLFPVKYVVAYNNEKAINIKTLNKISLISILYYINNKFTINNL